MFAVDAVQEMLFDQGSEKPPPAVRGTAERCDPMLACLHRSSEGLSMKGMCLCVCVCVYIYIYIYIYIICGFAFQESV